MKDTYLGRILERILKSIENGDKTYNELMKDDKSFVKISNGKINLAFDLSGKTDTEILQELIKDGFEIVPRINIGTPKKSGPIAVADMSNLEGLAKVSEAHCKNYSGTYHKE